MRAFNQYIPFVYAVAFLGIVPFLHSHALNDPVQYPQFLAIAVCGLLLGAALWFTQKSDTKFQSWAWWPMGAIALLSFLSSFWALNPAEAWFSAARWMIACGFVLLSQIVLSRWPDTLLLICKVLTVSIGSIAVVGLLQAQGIDPLKLSDGYNSPNATLANRNFYGSVLFLGICFAAYGSFKLDLRWKIASIVAMALMVTGILVAGTRAALVPLLIGLLIFPPAFVWRRMHGNKRVIFLISWAIVLGLAGWSSQFALGKKDARIHYALLWENGKIVTPSSSSIDFRLISWHHSMKMARERPFLGYGAGNWKMNIQRIGLQSFDEKGNFGMVVPLHPHNEFLLSAAELGIPGLLIFLSIWVMGSLGALRMAINRGAIHDAVLGACLLLAWLGMLIDASFSFPMERPFHLLLFCIVFVLSLRGFKAQNITLARLRLGLAFAGLLLLIAAIDIGARLQIDAIIRQVREAKESHQAQKVLQLRNKATSWATQLDPVAALALDWYSAIAYTELKDVPKALQTMEKAEKISPHHIALRSGMASLLDMSGQYQTAIQRQTELLAVYPNFSEGWLNLSIMHVHAGQFEAARAALSKIPSGEFPAQIDQVNAVLQQAQQ